LSASIPSTPEIKICVDQPDDELEAYRSDDLEVDWSYENAGGILHHVAAGLSGCR